MSTSGAQCVIRAGTSKWRKMPDTVEEVWFGVIAGARIRDRGHAGERRVASARCDRRRHRNQLGELAKVLGGGGEVELIAGAVRPT